MVFPWSPVTGRGPLPPSPLFPMIQAILPQLLCLPYIRKKKQGLRARVIVCAPQLTLSARRHSALASLKTDNCELKTTPATIAPHIHRSPRNENSFSINRLSRSSSSAHFPFSPARASCFVWSSPASPCPPSRESSSSASPTTIWCARNLKTRWKNCWRNPALLETRATWFFPPK